MHQSAHSQKYTHQLCHRFYPCTQHVIIHTIHSIYIICEFPHKNNYVDVSTQTLIMQFKEHKMKNTTHSLQLQHRHTHAHTRAHTLVLLPSLMFCFVFCFHYPFPTHTFKYVRTLLSDYVNP